MTDVETPAGELHVLADMPPVSTKPRTPRGKVSTEPLMSRGAVAAWLGVTTQTLAIWATNGVGPKFILIGGSIRFRASDVNAWLNANTRTKANPHRV